MFKEITLHNATKLKYKVVTTRRYVVRIRTFLFVGSPWSSMTGNKIQKRKHNRIIVNCNSASSGTSLIKRSLLCNCHSVKVSQSVCNLKYQSVWTIIGNSGQGRKSPYNYIIKQMSPCLKRQTPQLIFQESRAFGEKKFCNIYFSS